ERCPLSLRDALPILRPDVLTDRVLPAGVPPQHQCAVTSRGDRHVSVDQEGQPAEHPLLGQTRLALENVTDPLGQLLVIRHALSMPTRTDRRPRPDQSPTDRTDS